MTPSFWKYTIVGGWFAVLGVAGYVNFLPGSNWIVVNSVHVEDTTVDVTPRMRVDRTIVTPFVGHRIVEVEQAVDDGFTLVCSEDATISFNLDGKLPRDLTLDWWMYPKHCDLEPGQYRVETTWVIDAVGFPPKEVNIFSNTFTVRK